MQRRTPIDRFTAITGTYWLCCISVALLLPETLKLPAEAREFVLSFPTIRALVAQRGALEIIPEFFAVAWGLLPVFLLVLVLHPPQFRPERFGVRHLVQVTLAALLLLLIFCFVLLYLNPSPTPGRRVASLLRVGSQSRLGLGLLFGALMTALLVVVWTSCVVVPRAWFNTCFRKA